ncbi:MAG TPA: phosphodiester glycosidase family protein [Longimicrobiales bacterium]|nr:phosphodiester glycosidase family protein [Longimicrobiales bacterium]
MWARAVAVIGIAVGACAPADIPPALSGRIPEAVVELLRPDTIRGGRIAPGVWYRFLWSREGPWAIHVVEADLLRCDLALSTLRAESRESGGRGHEAVSSMVARTGAEVLAAVNADFFTPEGTTLGPEVVKGTVTAARARPALAWRRGVAPWMGSTSLARDSLWARWAIALGAGDGTTELVGGYPELLDRGARVGDLGVGERPSFAASRHPRTAVGWDPSRARLILLVVDGRQAPYSVGMTLPELTLLLEAFGAREALNLDGGGSSVMVVLGAARNRPSDETGERAVVNALALVRDPGGCAPR